MQEADDQHLLYWALHVKTASMPVLQRHAWSEVNQHLQRVIAKQSQASTRQTQDTRQEQDRHKTGPDQVKATQAAHEALDVVGSPEDGLSPPWLLLDLGLDARLHAVQHTRHCCKDAGLQRCHIISHLRHITLQRQGHDAQAREGWCKPGRWYL